MAPPPRRNPATAVVQGLTAAPRTGHASKYCVAVMASQGRAGRGTGEHMAWRGRTRRKQGNGVHSMKHFAIAAMAATLLTASPALAASMTIEDFESGG
jgi:hypothetical protein